MSRIRSERNAIYNVEPSGNVFSAKIISKPCPVRSSFEIVRLFSHRVLRPAAERRYVRQSEKSQGLAHCSADNLIASLLSRRCKRRGRNSGHHFVSGEMKEKINNQESTITTRTSWSSTFNSARSDKESCDFKSKTAVKTAEALNKLEELTWTLIFCNL